MYKCDQESLVLPLFGLWSKLAVKVNASSPSTPSSAVYTLEEFKVLFRLQDHFLQLPMALAFL